MTAVSLRTTLIGALAVLRIEIAQILRRHAPGSLPHPRLRERKTELGA